jgi:hypothetical protein
MSVAAPQLIVKPFGAAATNPDYITLPIPVAAPVTPGQASFDEGFPPVTMTDPALGGVPPFGQDFNGLNYMITSYLAWLQGGGGFFYDAAFVAANTGYAIGAILKSASTAGRFWYNTTADNANDPDVTPTGWVPYSVFASPTGAQAAAPGAGTFTVALTAGAGFLEVTPTGNATLTNITGAFVGQILTITNLSGAFSLTIQAGANFRMNGDLGLIQNNSASFRWNGTTWVPLNG